MIDWTSWVIIELGIAGVIFGIIPFVILSYRKNTIAQESKGE